MEYFPQFDGSQESDEYKIEEMKDPWNDKKYVILPQKIRLKMKDMREQHIIMWQQLTELNDKLLVHNQKQVETRRPMYEQKFYDKKRDELVNKLSKLLH